MARFSVGYSEEYYGVIYFEADSLDDAKRIVAEACDDWDVIESVPGFYQKVCGGGFDFEWNAVEEVE
jgi:hypothetical protein